MNFWEWYLDTLFKYLKNKLVMSFVIILLIEFLLMAIIGIISLLFLIVAVITWGAYCVYLQEVENES